MLTKQQRNHQRYARKGTTTERDYGWSHVKKLRAALALWTPGDPCAHCGQPMWSRWTYDKHGRQVSALDLGHTPDRSAYIGLCHRHCNRSEGASRGNRTRRMVQQQQRASRQW